jgi:hypothetical protein
MRPPPALPSHLREFAEANAGKGVSTRFADRAPWLGNDPRTIEWCTALRAIDENGDKAPLLRLLRESRCELTPDARHYLADLLDRYNLKRKRGKKATPAYNKSPVEEALWHAVKKVRARAAGVSVEDAVAAAATEFSLRGSAVSRAYYRKRGGSNRVNRRTAK